MAKAVVEFQYPRKEADLFTKFTAEQLTELETMGAQKGEPHICYSHEKAPPGEFKNISDHINYKLIPNELANLHHREIEVWKVVESVMQDNKLTFMLGLHGTGKSSIVRQALHYICDSKFFTGGVIQIQLSNIKDTYALNKSI